MSEKEKSFLSDIPESEKQEETKEEKIEFYKKLLDGSEAVFCLDADIRDVKTKEGKTIYRPTAFTTKDAHGYLAGGHSRIIAAAELASYFPDLKIITTSWYQPDKPIHAEVYAKELERMGVPKNQIEMEKKSRSTLESLVEFIKIGKKEGWKAASILTSEYHIPRTKAMVENLEWLAERFNLNDEEFKKALEEFKKEPFKINYISPEEILPHRDKRYQKIIDEVKTLDAYKQRVEAEARGVEQIKNKTYGKK